MAKVIARVVGGDLKEHQVTTLGELKTKLDVSNYSALVNDEPVSEDSYEFFDNDVVELSPKVKGA